jgi:hypothetical protein
MQNAASTDPQSAIRNDSHHSIVANLVSLIEHLDTSSRVLELAIVRETAHGGPDVHEDTVILDDITPCYLSANAALNACHAGLAVALHGLLGAHPTKVETRRSKAADRGAAGSTVSA